MGFQLEEFLPLQCVGSDPAEVVESSKLYGSIADCGRQCLQTEVLLLLGCIGLGSAEGRWFCADRLAGRQVLAQSTGSSARGRRSSDRRLDPGDHELVGGLEPTNRGAARARLVGIRGRS